MQPGDPDPPRLGFYGKLPMRGDFLSRRLPRGFIDPWDSWLQESIAASREQLGDAWLPTYLTSPLWRFMLGAGICGDAPVIGVMMPSVDSVGRYFPVVLALVMSSHRAPVGTMSAARPWFEEVEKLALSALDDRADLDQFDRSIAAVAEPPAGAVTGIAMHSSESAIFAKLEDSANLAAATGTLVDGLMMNARDPYTLWWTNGSEAVHSGVIAAAGLPPSAGFAALLDGQWERWGWKSR
jgi:type VI secretion system protein ImpM